MELLVVGLARIRDPETARQTGLALALGPRTDLLPLALALVAGFAVGMA